MMSISVYPDPSTDRTVEISSARRIWGSGVSGREISIERERKVGREGGTRREDKGKNGEKVNSKKCPSRGFNRGEVWRELKSQNLGL